MAELPATPTATFDLAAEADRFSRGRWATRAAYLGIGVMLPALAIFRWATRAPDPIFASLLLGVTVSFPILGVWGFIHTRRPATEAAIDEEGVHFRYPSGVDRLLRWQDPNFDLRLLDARRDEAHGGPRPDRYYEVLAESPWSVWPPAALSAAAFTRIAEAAESHGLKVRPADWREPPNSALRTRVLTVRRAR